MSVLPSDVKSISHVISRKGKYAATEVVIRHVSAQPCWWQGRLIGQFAQAVLRALNSDAELRQMTTGSAINKGAFCDGIFADPLLILYLASIQGV